MHVCEMSRYGVNITGGHKIVGSGLGCSSHPDASGFHPVSLGILTCEWDKVPLAVLLPVGDYVGEDTLLTMKLYRKVAHFNIYFLFYCKRK